MNQKNHHILIIDDSKLMLKVLQQKLKRSQFHIHATDNIERALEVLNTENIEIVLTDKMMPDTDGLDIIRMVRENYENTGIIMITGYATMQGAIEAVKLGADEYLEKPVKEDELFPAIDRLLEKIKRKKVSLGSATGITKQHGIVGESSAMHKVFDAMQKVSAIPATVLLTGESGTGKELVARAIHYESPRAGGPFVAVNCSAIPETLLESELFGSVKGAYTGSIENRQGYVQAAKGGTLFLDEISTTSLPLQSKLLRVVQEKEIVQVGDNKPQAVDVKIIVATNHNLQELVKKNLFREDLYYRLNVLSINLPPLSERGDDVFLLVNYFSQKYAGEFGKTVPHFTDDALKVLSEYSWPGNIRELENLVQRLIAMHDSSEIDVKDLPAHMRFHVIPKSNHLKSLSDVELEHINLVLDSVNGNKTKAAEILGIDRKTLRQKLKRLIK
jgi:DNA-binding NtrC family response regulator